MKKVLFVGAHTDDIELGCGGTVARLLDEHWSVHYLILSIARASVPKGYPEDVLKYEALEASRVMGVSVSNVTILDYPVRMFPENRQPILEDLVRIRRENEYDAVMCHSRFDVHQDHQATANECLRAFKGLSILSYELPWNSVGSIASMPDFYIRLSEEQISRKICAIRCFKTQSSASRSYVNDEYLRGWARMRGQQASCEYAEAFSTNRIIM